MAAVRARQRMYAVTLVVVALVTTAVDWMGTVGGPGCAREWGEFADSENELMFC